jgi:hypothetical protein
MRKKIIVSSCNILFGGSRGNFNNLMKKIANTNFDILFIQESYGNIHKIVQKLQNLKPSIKLSYNPKTNIIVKGNIISFNANDNFHLGQLENNQILLLGNCHLPSDYSDYTKINDFDYEFKHRLVYLKSIMKSIYKYSKHYPTILSGDFNTIQKHVEYIGSKYGFVDKTNDTIPTWNINLNLHQDQVDNFTIPLKIDFILHNELLKHIDYNVVPLIESDHALITKTFYLKLSKNHGFTVDRYTPDYLTKPAEFYDQTKESNFEIKFLSTNKFKIKYINCPGNRYDWITFYNPNNKLVGYIYTRGSVNKTIKYSNTKSIKSEFDHDIVYFPKFIANESYIAQYMIDDGYTPFDKIQNKIIHCILHR